MQKTIKVCHISSVHSRYDIRIFIKQCSSLAKLGYDTYFIVADGKGDETKNGVKIIDVGIAKDRLRRFLISSFKAYKTAKYLECDIYHFHDPELMFYGLLLQKKETKVIYDIHEDLSKQLLIKPWIPKFLRKITSRAFGALESLVAKRLDALIVPQPHMLKEYKTLNEQTVLVANFVILTEKDKDVEIDYTNKTAFHAGALSEDRGLNNMIDAYKKIDNTNILILAGKLNKEHIDNPNFIQSNNIFYEGMLSHEKVDAFYRKSSLGLILYNNVGQYYLSYAIKLFEYMKYGIPVIMPNFGEWLSFNNENKCGINVDVTDPNDIIKAISYLNENPEKKRELGLNGKKAVTNKYSWQISEGNLNKLYSYLIQ